MTMYRDVQSIRDTMLNLDRTVRAGILADSTRDMSARASEGMAMVDQVLQTLRTTLNTGSTDSDLKVERPLLEAAQRALDHAWSRAERVAIGNSASEMREYLVDFKTWADFATAYLSAALGSELENV